MTGSQASSSLKQLQSRHTVSSSERLAPMNLGNASSEANAAGVTSEDEAAVRIIKQSYRSIMQGSPEHEQNYEREKRKISQQIADREYWPDGMTHPKEYRGFYWTKDMAFCGFATMNSQAYKTLGGCTKKLDSMHVQKGKCFSKK